MLIIIKRPIVVAVIGYIIGIIWGLYFNFSIVLLYFPMSAIYILIKNRFNSKGKFKLFSIKRYFRYLKLFIPFKTLICIIIFSIISNTIVIIQNRRYETLYEEGDIEFTGVIISDKKESEYNNTYKIKVLNSKISKKVKGTYLYIKVGKNQRIELKYGDNIHVEGEFKKPEKQRNYGGYDGKTNFKMNDIYGTVRGKLY